MSTNLTEIAFILDASGSMSTIWRATIDGFNNLLLAQQDTPGRARFTLVVFETTPAILIDGVPISEVLPITTATHRPGGGTALFDAIGTTIAHLNTRIANSPETDRPDKVILAILTDGYENASRRFSRTDIQQQIKHHKEQHGWDILFLGANQDPFKIGKDLGIDRANISRWNADDEGIHTSMQELSRTYTSIRLNTRDIDGDGDGDSDSPTPPPDEQSTSGDPS